MSRNQRLILLGLAALVVVVAVVVASTSGGGSKSAATTTTRSTTATATAPSVARAALSVKGGQAVGGVKDIAVTKGERVAITVTSPDYSGEIHLHGYDVKRDVAPGKPARFDLRATQEGVFEMEVEATSTQIARLTVNP